MTIVTVQFAACDAPDCTTRETVEFHGAPPGWRRVASTDHLAEARERLGKQRRNPARLAAEDSLSVGLFMLHLCPAHHDAYAAHLPRTTGYRSRSSALVDVSCSCGEKLGRFGDVTLVLAPGATGPRRNTARAWWSHLPADLKTAYGRNAA